MAHERRRVTAIVNPATRGDFASLREILTSACPADVELTVTQTTSPGHAADLARRAAGESDIVIAVGGDGTVADVATGLAGATTRLGIVPVGSTNITAQELGIPLTPRLAAAVIFGPHEVRTLDAGVCGERRFLHMAGAGLDSHFFQRTSRAMKRRWGWLAYIPAATIALRQPPAAFSITVDGQALDVVSPMVLVANGGSVISPVFKIFPDIRTDDGLLDVLVFTATTPTALTQTVTSFVTRSLGRSAHVTRMRGQRVDLAAIPTLPVQLDGDVVTVTPVSFGIEPGGLRVIAPLRSGRARQRSRSA